MMFYTLYVIGIILFYFILSFHFIVILFYCTLMFWVIILSSYDVI